MKNNQYLRPVIIAILVILGLVFLFSRTAKDEIKTEQVYGNWMSEEKDVFLKLTPDSMFTLYISGSSLNLEGTWCLSHNRFPNDTTNFILLQNSKPQEVSREEYFGYYLLEVNKVSDQTLVLRDWCRIHNQGIKYVMKRREDI